MAVPIRGGEAAVLANGIAVAISKDLTPDQLNILGNLVTLIGASLLSIAAIEQTAQEQATGESEKTSGNHRLYYSS